MQGCGIQHRGCSFWRQYFGHLGIDETRRNAIDAYRRGKSLTAAAGQGNYASLTAGVVNLRSTWAQRSDGGNQYDRAALPLDHFIFDGEHDAKSTIEIDVDRLEPEVVCKICVVGGIADGATMRQVVNRSQRFACLAHQFVDLVLFRDVALHADCFPAERFNFGDDGVSGSDLGTVTNCYVSALARQLKGGRSSNSARSSSNDGNTICKCSTHEMGVFFHSKGLEQEILRHHTDAATQLQNSG